MTQPAAQPCTASVTAAPNRIDRAAVATSAARRAIGGAAGTVPARRLCGAAARPEELESLALSRTGPCRRAAGQSTAGEGEGAGEIAVMCGESRGGDRATEGYTEESVERQPVPGQSGGGSSHAEMTADSG